MRRIVRLSVMRTSPRLSRARGLVTLARAVPTHRISGWGRHPFVEADERRGEDLEELTKGVELSRGLGRSYGDSSLPSAPGRPVAATPLANRLLAFDAETGLLRAEAGLALADLNRWSWPRGFTCPVLPGTHSVTLGGMVAADVHGKNHHVAGCIGEHVTALRMRVADGRILEVTDYSRNPTLTIIFLIANS